jgi:catechol 2,3-dioxygenase-like lactoylglutathione lyase family enzyme
MGLFAARAMIEGTVMHNGTIEHANLTVSDIERSSALFQKLLGWHERWRGAARRATAAKRSTSATSIATWHFTPIASRTNASPRAFR